MRFCAATVDSFRESVPWGEGKHAGVNSARRWYSKLLYRWFSRMNTAPIHSSFGKRWTFLKEQ